FTGIVTEVRNAAIIVQDVVTYGTVIEVANPDLALRPGMTASVRVRTGAARNVLRVPNTGLHFVPPNQRAPDGPGAWTLDGETLRHVAVRPGLSDGQWTEIQPGTLGAGRSVLVELTHDGRRAYGIAH
ncbi:MAG: efflux RND transporter periplasmic adaptor subunit, partial [Deltaproteobacteria bacterium]